MTLAAPIPGTIAAVLAGVDLRVQLALRTELRRLRNASDAMLAVLYVADARERVILEHGGDAAVMPNLPPEGPTAVNVATIRCIDGDDHVVALLAVRIGRGWPRLGLAVVDPHVAMPELTDAVESAVERLEAILVLALAKRRG